MKTKTRNLAIIVILSSGCDFGWGDPCEVSNPSHEGLSDQQKINCTRCGEVECGEGETGGAWYEYLACPIDGPGFGWNWCDVGGGVVQDDQVVVEESVCVSTSHPNIMRAETWSTPVRPVHAGELLRWCAPPGPNFNYGDDQGSTWKLCRHEDNVLGWIGASVYYPATAEAQPGANWIATALCEDPSDTEAGACGLGLVSVGGDYFNPDGWTCACDSDADCQIGGTCHAGWYFDGIHPYPTLCTWDEAEPLAGPLAYGLHEWSDGMTVEGHDVTMTPAMLVAATRGQAGLWNDDQRIDETGMIEHCGDGSLCDHLGLAVGDNVDGDFEQMAEVLPMGLTVPLMVTRASGEEEIWTITSEPKGGA